MRASFLSSVTTSADGKAVADQDHGKGFWPLAWLFENGDGDDDGDDGDN